MRNTSKKVTGYTTIYIAHFVTIFQAAVSATHTAGRHPIAYGEHEYLFPPHTQPLSIHLFPTTGTGHIPMSHCLLRDGQAIPPPSSARRIYVARRADICLSIFPIGPNIYYYPLVSTLNGYYPHFLLRSWSWLKLLRLKKWQK